MQFFLLVKLVKSINFSKKEAKEVDVLINQGDILENIEEEMKLLIRKQEIDVKIQEKIENICFLCNRNEGRVNLWKKEMESVNSFRQNLLIYNFQYESQFNMLKESQKNYQRRNFNGEERKKIEKEIDLQTLKLSKIKLQSEVEILKLQTELNRLNLKKEQKAMNNLSRNLKKLNYEIKERSK